MINKLALACVIVLVSQAVNAPAAARNKQRPPHRLGTRAFFPAGNQDKTLPPPILLRNEEMLAGNPLATYAAMLDLESDYLHSKVFADFYREVRFNIEEFLGFPLAGIHAMSLPALRLKQGTDVTSFPKGFQPEDALKVIEREAQKTRLVIWGEEHHLPQTRSLYEALLRMLWRQGYRYLAAETFDEYLLNRKITYPDYKSGYYVRDPVFGNAIRTAINLGYELIPYDTNKLGPRGDSSFRDRTQAERIKARIFDRDPHAKVLIIAGRGHASEEPAQDGWTPMASVLKRLTGINPLTLYAPRMTQRLTPEEEDSVYRFATSRGLVNKPMIFVNRSDRRLLGSTEGDLDAYIFWPRVRVINGRPDWMIRELGRRAVKIPAPLLKGPGLRLIQVFRNGDPASSIPIDQVVIDTKVDKVLMLPSGRYWIRAVDRDSKEIGKTRLTVS
ncbi:MAG TPA: hypothetical protein VJT71_12030 [Pyrinomonadaceae bacterium]|nr:hypothetical protein [Pyrinomonadaceae bacterium]